jgi:hypothetical protein
MSIVCFGLIKFMDCASTALNDSIIIKQKQTLKNFGIDYAAHAFQLNQPYVSNVPLFFDYVAKNIVANSWDQKKLKFMTEYIIEDATTVYGMSISASEKSVIADEISSLLAGYSTSTIYQRYEDALNQKFVELNTTLPGAYQRLLDVCGTTTIDIFVEAYGQYTGGESMNLYLKSNNLVYGSVEGFTSSISDINKFMDTKTIMIGIGGIIALIVIMLVIRNHRK